MIERFIPWQRLPRQFYAWANARHDTCWTNLVMRKIYGYDDLTPSIFQVGACDADYARCGECFCGKRIREKL